MHIIHTIDALTHLVRQWRTHHERIAYVPTMGALHAGHSALLQAARASADRLILSIFVNPMQFGPTEDLATYPRTFDADCVIAQQCEVDAIFAPTVETIYPEGDQTVVDVGPLAEGLCGAHRPGHFRGVATVVCKLFHIMAPDVAYFGEKDYQQLQLIRRMVRDLHWPITIVGLPTVREADGLALSSRNRHLAPSERARALAIPRALHACQARARTLRETAPLIAGVQAALAQALDRIDYVAIVDAEDLTPLASLDRGPTATGVRPARLCVAGYLGTTRLIDNIALVPHDR